MTKVYVKKLATIKDSADCFYQIGKAVYRVSDETLDAFGVPQAKRWECSMEHFLHYQGAGVFGELTFE